MERVLEQDQYLGVLAAKIEQQQAQIRALELEAKSIGSSKDFIGQNGL